MIEQKIHTDAYFYWFDLTEQGLKTSEAIDKTAEQFGFKKRALWRWYNEFNWKNRAIEKRKKIVDQVDKKQNRTLAENRLNYLKIMHKVLDEYIKQGDFSQIGSAKDLETIIKTCLVLQEAPSEVTKSDSVNVNVDAESLFDEDLMQKILDEENNEDNNDLTDEFKIDEDTLN